MSIVLVGSTSGSITLQEPAVAGTTVLNLPAVSGTIVTTGSPQSGSVLQVVQGTQSGAGSTSSTSFTSTGLTATITPKFSTSKILCILSLSARANSANGGAFTLFRGTTSGTDLSNSSNSQGFGDIVVSYYVPLVASILDNPATTSAVTYTAAVRNFPSATTVAWSANGAYSTLTLMEIAA